MIIIIIEVGINDRAVMIDDHQGSDVCSGTSRAATWNSYNRLLGQVIHDVIDGLIIIIIIIIIIVIIIVA